MTQAKVKHPKLIHVTTIPLSLGFLRGQIGFMREMGLTVMAVSSPGPELEDFRVTQDVRVAGVPLERSISLVADVVSLVRLFLLFRKEKPDIVHTHTPKAGLLGMIAALLARVPVRIFHLHGLAHQTSSGLKRKLLRASDLVSCRAAVRVLCVSDSIRDLAIEEHLCPPDKIEVPHHGSIDGVDSTGRFNPDAQDGPKFRRENGLSVDAFVVGYAGRFARDKGLTELAEAWRMVRGALPSAHLLLAGEADDRDPIPSPTLELLRADPSVTLLGWMEDTPTLYASVDLLVLPSYREGFPVSLMEAAAMGKAVVATDVAGCTDSVVQDVTGTLVPPRDARALAEAILKYARDTSLRTEHGAAGRQRVLEQFRPKDIAIATLNTYSVLLSSYGRPVGEAHSPSGRSFNASDERI